MQAIVFDTETSGLIDNPAKRISLQPEVISFASVLVDFDKKEIGAPFYKIFKPKKPIDSIITRITKFTNEYLNDMPPIEDSIDDILSILSGAPLIIGQNISFDQAMIDFECKRYGRTIKWPKAIDLIANTIHIKGYRLSLTNLHMELFKEGFDSAHRADVDAYVTAKCAIEMFERGLL